MLRRQAIAGKFSTDEIIQENGPLSLTVRDSQTALIVVDHQQGIIGFQSIHPMAEVIDRTRSLIEAFRRNELPVVLVNVAGAAPGRTEQPRRHPTLPEGWTDLTPEVDPRSSDILVTKRTWGRICEHRP